MKYNKSEIMKAAWKTFRMSQKWAEQYRLTFAECLRRAWAEAKKAVVKASKLNGFVYGRFEIGFSTLFANVAEGIVSGQTYNVSKVLRSYGLRFNGTEKYWEGTKEQVKNLVAAYI